MDRRINPGNDSREIQSRAEFDGQYHNAGRAVLTLADVAAALARHGLVARGGFHPDEADGVPALDGGVPVRSVVLVGNAGPAMWREFAASPEMQDGADDPLDRWSTRVIREVARGLGAAPLFPFGGPPYLPFQRWAMKAEPVHASPLGMLIHPEYGLWHAYRGALAWSEPVDLPARPAAPHPCGSCADKPCLTACPVGAFTGAGYDVPRCARHLDTPAGRDCMELGCRARRVCPVGQDWRYVPAQAEFHMRPFRRNALALLRAGS